ncbi:MAG: VCBS repeat-containing protein [Gammaproteobacteria bacterium]|nr:VCBS repeat-containing protein [Gammaproteobacteria bacterium]
MFTSYFSRQREAACRLSKRLRMVGPALFLAGLQLGCASSPAGASGSELFEHLTFATGSGKAQTVVEGYFLGDNTAQLMVLSVDEEGERKLQMYRLTHNAWVPVLESTMDKDVLFVDVAGIAGRDRLVTIKRGLISWFDPETVTYHPIATVYSNYNASQNSRGSTTRAGGEVATVDIARDLNLDGRDDLIIPDFDGFWVATQLADGSFSEPARYGPPEPFLDAPAMNEDKSYRSLGISAGTIPVYLSRIHQFDQNQDGRADLVFWNNDHFDVYLQNADGLFETEPAEVKFGVPFDSDATYSRAYDFVDEGMISLLFGLNQSSTRKILHSFQDMNADNVADMVTLTLSGRSMLRQRSVYEVYFGETSPEGISFSAQASAILKPAGRAGGMQPWGYSSQLFKDMNGDGQPDVMFRDVRVGFGGMARAMVGNSVALDLEFYRQQDGVFPDKLVTRKKVRRFSPLSGIGNIFFPPVLLGDVDGDGRSDLLIGQSPKELFVWQGVAGDEAFAREPGKVKVDLPADERNIWLSDLNGDGKMDVIIVAGAGKRSPDQSRSVTTLIAC